MFKPKFLSAFGIVVNLIIIIVFSLFLLRNRSLSTSESALAITQQAITEHSLVTTQDQLSLSITRKSHSPYPLLPPKLNNGSEFEGFIHNPRFSPFSDKYIFTALVNGSPSGLWLASIAKGIETQLVQEQNVIYNWSYDDHHVVYSPSPKLVTNADGSVVPDAGLQPVYLVDLENGEQRIIGEMTQGWGGIVSAPTGDIAFEHGDDIYVINPIHNTEYHISGSFWIGVPPIPTPQSTPTSEITSEKIPDFMQPSVSTGLPLPATASENANVFGCSFPNCQIQMKISANGKKLAILQTFLGRVTLVIVEIKTLKTVFVAEHLDGWYPFGWSPDSTQLAYAVIPEETRIPELWIVNADGGAPRQLAVAVNGLGRFGFVTWLANGKDILYIDTPSGSPADHWAKVQVVSTEGGELFTLFTDVFMLQLFNHGKQIEFWREKYDEEQPYYRNWVTNLFD